MRYLCLIATDENQWAAMPAHEQEAIVAEHFAFDEDLRRRGILVSSEALQPSATATTVRLRQGRVTTTDGPFAETREQLGGYYLIEARDLNDAITIAAQIPSARLGCVEVRPVWELASPEAGGDSTSKG